MLRQPTPLVLAACSERLAYMFAFQDSPFRFFPPDPLSGQLSQRAGVLPARGPASHRQTAAGPIASALASGLHVVFTDVRGGDAAGAETVDSADAADLPWRTIRSAEPRLRERSGDAAGGSPRTALVLTQTPIIYLSPDGPADEPALSVRRRLITQEAAAHSSSGRQPADKTAPAAASL